VLSEELEARIDAELGFPTHDPHGDPIPDSELRLAAHDGRTLASLSPGEHSTVTRVPDESADVLRYLAELSLLPGERVEVVLTAPFDGPVTVRAGGTEHALSRELAASIGVA
jgi:DtxR family Mn-dependent transcriptional regulator